MTAESALIIPVAAVEPVVAGLRERFDPSAARGMPAHITVLYPFLPPGDVDGAVLDELRRLFAGVAPVPFGLTATGRFPGVLYLAPHPEEPFARFTAAVATRWPETPPYGGAHEEIVPHLTVAHSDDPELLDRLDSELASQLPLTAVAAEVWLLEYRDAVWRRRARLPFEAAPLTESPAD